MKKKLFKKFIDGILLYSALLLYSHTVCAQTDADALMMTKNNFCVGGVYSYSSWKNYWEGALKRNNENLGTVSTQMYAVMGNYGISNKLNVLFGLPYVQTKATGGTLHGQKGLQDLSLWIKWMPYEKQVGPGILAFYGIGGYSLPVSSYVADMLPLSLGLRSKNTTLRLMADYQIDDWFATLSGSYIIRSNIEIDRTAYYTTQQHNTNDVAMPDVIQYSARAGYRTERLIGEAVFTNWITQGGFDITRNNMPFPSNQMNMVTIGGNFKYNVKAVDGLSIIGGANTVIGGRNVGQSTGFNAGIFYIISFTGRQRTSSQTSPKQN
jgi:hypothetical protein